MTLTSEVFFTIEITSFPTGGMITRIACGNTMRMNIVVGRIPSAIAARVCPRGTERMPARMTSAV
jgi:hypothetical protein